MAEPALRVFAVAGVLASGLLFGGLTSAPVLADPSGSSQDSGGSGTSSGGTSGSGSQDSGSGSSSSSSSDSSSSSSTGSGSTESGSSTDTSGGQSSHVEPPPPDPEPTVSVDTGEADTRTTHSDPAPALAPAPARESQKTDYSNSITLPFVRLPAPGEVPAGSWPAPSTFYTTVEIPVPTLQQFLEALQILPPTPPPGPAFRTQEQAPIIDATTGTSTGGGGGGGGGRADSPVLRAPLVVTVPRALTAAGAGPRLPEVAPAARPGGNGVTQPGVAGVRTPKIRGSVPATPGVAAEPAAAPAGRPAIRESGYPRGITGPSVAEIAAVALPGVAGLMFLTFSGGFIGYRQANSVRFVRTAGAERFLQ
ncbi:hypothetical protein Mycch_5079 [Mycolicibacterium chubuense NBB4]|uniref:IgA FC receptor n=1 Tax=Mycolicibacterium chubuense (strain NBB4) TaxID=710421 RepID=I4BR58_MYCCN|nr:hypothetical protein [Mycolicibacterium chubuense]AFM19765.1 hypothetical protein Mycch_5079 [Mycolicibacterium chubuense NBB4]